MRRGHGQRALCRRVPGRHDFVSMMTPRENQRRTSDDLPGGIAPLGAEMDRRGESHVDDLVREIRENLAAISAKELELRRREQDVSRQFQDLKHAAATAAAEELEDIRARLGQQATELNAQALEVSARRQQITQFAERLRARQIELEQQRADLARQSQRTRQQAQEVQTWRERHRGILRRRLQKVRRRQQELRERLEQAHADLQAARQAIAEQQGRLQARVTRLQDAERSLEARQGEWEQLRSQHVAGAGGSGSAIAALATLDEQRAKLEAFARHLGEERTQISREWDQLEGATQALDEERGRIAGEWRQLEATTESLESERSRIAGEQKQIDRERRALIAREAELERILAAQQQVLAQAQRTAQNALADETAQQRAGLEREHELHKARLARELEQSRQAAEAELEAERTRAWAEIEGERAAFDEELRARKLAFERELTAHQIEGDRTVERVRYELERERRQVQQRIEDLEQAQTTLAAERSAWEAARSEAAAALESTRAQHVAEHQRLATELQQRAQHLTTLEAQLGQRVEATRSQRRNLAKQAQEMESRQHELAARETDIRDRDRALAEREADLLERTAALAVDKDRLAEAQAHTQAVQLEAQSSARQARLLEEGARQEHAAALARRDELDAREAEVRQAVLTLEVERRALEAGVAQSSASEEQALALVEREQELAQREVALTRRMAETARAAASGTPGRSGTGWTPWQRLRRCAVVAVLAALCVGATWQWGRPLEFGGAVEIEVAGGPAATAQTQAEWCAALEDTGLLQFDAVRAVSWAEAVRQGRVRATFGGPAMVRLQLSGRGAAEVRDLLQGATGAFTERLLRGPVGLDPALADLVQRYERLGAALAAGEQARAQLVATLGEDLPRIEREAVTAQVDELEARYAQISERLASDRADLAALVAGDVPRGTVATEELVAALAGDALYQEDWTEQRAVAQQYRTELVVAMLMLVDPAREARRALQSFAATLDEQRELAPPADVAAGIEDCSVLVEAALAAWTGFPEQWQSEARGVQQLDVRVNPEPLLAAQAKASDEARRFGDALRTLINELGQRLEALAAGEGSTREVVVSALLRGEHTALVGVVDTVTAAVTRTSLATNIDLDAVDRKVRGLRTRLANREEAVRQQLQAFADEGARRSHADRLEATRVAVRELERERETIAGEMLAGLKQLRVLEETMRRRGAAEVALTQRDEELAWLRQRSAELEGEINELRAQQQPPERVAVGPIVVASREPQRPQQAVMVGTTAFFGVLLGGLWLTRPRR